MLQSRLRYSLRLRSAVRRWPTTTFSRQTSDPNNWASQSGDYALQRYSKLDQINTDNVKDLKVAWTFSTGVLRGHEGSPLVIGDTLYVHTPFPNIVYALDLDDENKIIWKYEPKQDPSVIPIMCCDTVNRGVAYADGKIFLYQADTTLVALDAKTGKEVWKTVNGDTKRGETGTNAPIVDQGQGDRRHLRRRVRRAGLRHRPTTSPTARAPGAPTRSVRTTRSCSIPRRPRRSASRSARTSSLKTWTGEQWKIGGGSSWGWYSWDPEAQPLLLRHRQPLDLEPGAARRTRQQADRPEVDAVDHRAQPRDGRRRLGLSAHAVRRVGL